VQINTTYDIGQKLYRVIVSESNEIKCRECGRKKFEVNKYAVSVALEKIIEIRFLGRCTHYRTYCVTLSESEIDCEGAWHFSDRQAAQDECDRRNKAETERINHEQN
jgi:hypothetical protein